MKLESKQREEYVAESLKGPSSSLLDSSSTVVDPMKEERIIAKRDELRRLQSENQERAL
jgi:adenylate kinase